MSSSGLCGKTGYLLWPWGNGHPTALCQTHRPTVSVTVTVYNENIPSQLSESQEPMRNGTVTVWMTGHWARKLKRKWTQGTQTSVPKTAWAKPHITVETVALSRPGSLQVSALPTLAEQIWEPVIDIRFLIKELMSI